MPKDLIVSIALLCSARRLSFILSRSAANFANSFISSLLNSGNAARNASSNFSSYVAGSTISPVPLDISARSLAASSSSLSVKSKGSIGVAVGSGVGGIGFPSGPNSEPRRRLSSPSGPRIVPRRRPPLLLSDSDGPNIASLSMSIFLVLRKIL